MTLVVDATVVVTSIASAEGFEALGEEDLVAQPLMWSEARSTLHLGLLNGKVSAKHAAVQHERLETCPVRRAKEPELGREADYGGAVGRVEGAGEGRALFLGNDLGRPAAEGGAEAGGGVRRASAFVDERRADRRADVALGV